MNVWDIEPSDREAASPRFEQSNMAWPSEAVLDGAAELGSDAGSVGPIGTGRGAGSLRDIFETVILTVLIAAGIQLAVQSRLVEGSSMEPTLHNGQRLLINRLSYLSPTDPQRGDIIVFRAWDQDEDYIKRVIGVPGDEIEIRGNEILVNGAMLDEPYLDRTIDYGHIGPLVMAPDFFYVMGDNRGNSSDSRLHGPLPRAQILGKAWVSYWPLANLGLISDSTSYAAER